MKVPSIHRFTATPLGMLTLVGLVIAATILASPPAAANVDTADALFQRARELKKQGRCREAIPMLIESNRIDAASGTLLMLAKCYITEGRMASARRALEDAKARANVEKRPERRQQARDLLTEIEGKVSYITITLSPEAAKLAGVEVRRDDEVLGKATFGVPVPVDAGPHRVSASASGFEPLTIDVQVGPNGDRKTVEIPLLKPSPPPPATPPAPPLVVEPSATSLAGEPGRRGTWRSAGLIVGGTGVAALVVGSIFGVMAKVNHDTAKRLCPASPCGSPAGLEANSAAITDANVANASLGIGVGLVATGVILYVSAPREPSAASASTTERRALSPIRSVAIEPLVGPTGVGLNLGGAF